MIHWTWAITFASLVGVVANIKKWRWCFAVWLVTNALWAIVDFSKGLPAQGWLFVVYTVLAVWGLWEWRLNPKRERSHTGSKQRRYRRGFYEVEGDSE